MNIDTRFRIKRSRCLFSTPIRYKNVNPRTAVTPEGMSGVNTVKCCSLITIRPVFEFLSKSWNEQLVLHSTAENSQQTEIISPLMKI
jgi:hypothetical protein